MEACAAGALSVTAARVMAAPASAAVVRVFMVSSSGWVGDVWHVSLRVVAGGGAGKRREAKVQVAG